MIVIDDLNVAGMSRRKPGAGRGGRGLNRAIADASLAQLRRMLSYKTGWYGARRVVADRWYRSSKTCSGCGGRKPNLSLADRDYVCDACGACLDRDLNAAINLARLGEHPPGGTSPAGSGPAARRGANQKTSPGAPGEAGGREASTPHDSTTASRGPPIRKERLPEP